MEVVVKGLVALVVLVVGVVGWGSVEPVAAEPSPPKVKARYAKRDDVVRVTWGGIRGVDRLVELERARDGGAFAPLDVVPRRPGRYLDAPEEGGTYRYRARVISDHDVSAWSAPASVVVPAPGGGGPGEGGPPLGAGQRECAPGTVEQVLALVNAARKNANRSALRLDSRLQWAARTRVIDMATKGKLSHDGWVAVVDKSGYHWSTLGENIALGYPSPSAVVGAWLGSSGHRANILGPFFRDTGIGCVIDHHGYTWWAEIFGG
jgi:hypothetical protein